MIPRHGTHDSDVILALATVGLVGLGIAARQACRPTTPAASDPAGRGCAGRAEARLLARERRREALAPVKLGKAQARARAAAEHLSAVHDQQPELQAEAAKALQAVRDLERAAARRLQGRMLR